MLFVLHKSATVIFDGMAQLKSAIQLLQNIMFSFFGHVKTQQSCVIPVIVPLKIFDLLLWHLKTIAPTHLKNIAATHLKTIAPTHLKTIAPTLLKTIAATHLKNIAATHLKTLAPTHLKPYPLPI